MPHQVYGRHLNRNTAQRRALFRALLNQLFEHERIMTTEAKAKAVRPDVEKLITLAKSDSVHGRRIALARLNNKETVKKLFGTLGPRYKERPGGYTRILKASPRLGDAAPMVVFELVDRE